MNDPLRDNRIFPEEMHEVIPRKEPAHHTHFWMWFVAGAIFIIALFWLAFAYVQDGGVRLFNNQPTEYEQQVAVFEKLNADRPVMTPEERADKINNLFGN